MNARRNNPIALILTAGLLAACGTPRPLNTPMPLSPTMPAAPTAAQPAMPAASTSTAKKTTTPSKTATSAKTTPAKAGTAKPAATKPAPTVSTQSAADQVAELRAGVKGLSDQTQNFQAKVQSWNVAKNGDKASVTVRYTFAKPSQSVFEIIKSTQESATGAKVLWTGGPKAKVRATVLGIPVKVDLDITDSRLANKRGYTFADTGIDRWERTILDPATQIMIRGKQTLPNGKTAIMFDCISPNMQPDITRETYGVDAETKAPLLCQYYEGDKCVYEVQILETATNLNLGPDTFTL
jgi:hypothetical protein